MARLRCQIKMLLAGGLDGALFVMIGRKTGQNVALPKSAR